MPGAIVWDRLRQHAEAAPDREAIVHVQLEGEPHRWRWGPLLRAASSASRWLAAKGVRAGEVCALVVRHHPGFYPLYLGVSALGALPAVLAYPNQRLHPDKFRQGLEGMARRSGLDHVLTERDLGEILHPLVSGGSSTVKSVLFPLDPAEGALSDGGPMATHPLASADDPCLVQHSSGTTGLQKPVTLSHRAVLEHLRRYGDAIGASAEDRIVSWLPLYHDMGLIAAFYLPLVNAIPLVQLSPMEWVAAPAMLLREITREKGTLCWLPNFAYNFIATRVRDEDLQDVRLDSMRMFVNCSEPVRAESHDQFHSRLARHGLRREALAACYAMAETTYAVTQTAPGQEARGIRVDRTELARGTVRILADGDTAAARTCVSSGRLIDGCAIRVVDEARNEVPPGKVGEIVVSSVSLFDGYRNYPEKTAEVLEDGWYYTGDLGFEHDGEWFIVGRRKDLIIIAGNNIYPEDVEDAVGRVPGVIPGRVVAFGVPDERLGTDVLCIAVESDVPDVGVRALRVAILQAGMSVDATISRVYVAPPRWMIKSSSGKPARSTNRDRALVELSWR